MQVSQPISSASSFPVFNLLHEANIGLLRHSATRKVLLEQMIFYVASVDTVDAICSGDTIPSLMQYWRRRERTAGVYPVMATIPFIYGYDISKADLATDLMTLLWRHTSYLVHMK
ncbi:hypothetical protein PENVUL_c020G08306 [Penicillium vulpinum]|uniref:Uncharacterized protein n=1 Tax=Penicillium vulpinum TaxID=29845 RepID=A0A1V6RWC1_9EURO|nr:hypothetical protein PENVUL_c020G08306 [Penicillium vulpinum]